MPPPQRNVKKKSFNRMSAVGDIIPGWKRRAGMEPDRMVVLNEVWEREVGAYSRHWALTGVKRGMLYVKVRSPAAAVELQFRGTQLIRSLNKYFKRSWIKSIRTMQG